MTRSLNEREISVIMHQIGGGVAGVMDKELDAEFS